MTPQPFTATEGQQPHKGGMQAERVIYRALQECFSMFQQSTYLTIIIKFFNLVDMDCSFHDFCTKLPTHIDGF